MIDRERVRRHLVVPVPAGMLLAAASLAALMGAASYVTGHRDLRALAIGFALAANALLVLTAFAIQMQPYGANWKPPLPQALVYALFAANVVSSGLAGGPAVAAFGILGSLGLFLLFVIAACAFTILVPAANDPVTRDVAHRPGASPAAPADDAAWTAVRALIDRQPLTTAADVSRVRQAVTLLHPPGTDGQDRVLAQANAYLDARERALG